MPDQNCAICVSPLRNEIEKRDSSMKADATIKWARKKGVRINRVSLARHRVNHTDNMEIQSQLIGRKTKANRLAKPEINKPSVIASIHKVDDNTFLDAVRDRVYEKLIDGQIDLKIDSGFKAIELKNKLSDVSQNEKLLLEILNEIRTDELNK